MRSTTIGNLAFALALVAAPVWGADPPLETKEGIIRGTMDIDFKSRTELDTSGNYVEGSSAKGAKDVYSFNIRVGETTEYQGKITRQPEIKTKNFLRVEQKPELGFDVQLAVRNPNNVDERKVVGKWVGTVPINSQTGVYDFAMGSGGGESILRFAIDAIGKQTAFNDKFGGKLTGKATKKTDLAQYTYKRLIKDKTVEFVVKKSDPMQFSGLELAKGPAGNYPRTIVDGRLDYDYETGNWLTDGIKFRYNYDGKDYEDIVTGSIKWVQDDNWKSNGKSYYDFNLRFNESKNKPATTEADAFKGLSDEDAFFAVDDSIPCLTGKVSYVDTFIPGKEEPAKSKVEYSLNANKVSKQQAVAFFKLWMVCIGPINDE